MKKKIVLFLHKQTRGVPELLNMIEEAGMTPEVIYDAEKPERIISGCKGADAVLTILTPFDKDIIKSLDSSVKISVVAAMGYDHIDVAAASERKIYVANIPDYAVQEVAVHQIALMLSALRKICLYNKILHNGEWTELDFTAGYPVHRLSGMCYGLLGFGKISRLVAKYTLAFGMSVMAYDPFIPKDFIIEAGVKYADNADKIFENCDIISPNIPLADESRYIIDKNAISKMKDGVIIVNTGRGALIEEHALIEGLESGKIRAAALDVFENEPFCDKTNPLMKMDNVIMTPHIAYHTEESEKEVMTRAVAAAISGAEGKIPLNVI